MQRYYKLEERVFDCLCQFTLAVNCGAREWRLPLRLGCDESERFAAEMTKESPENPPACNRPTWQVDGALLLLREKRLLFWHLWLAAVGDGKGHIFCKLKNCMELII